MASTWPYSCKNPQFMSLKISVEILTVVECTLWSYTFWNCELKTRGSSGCTVATSTQNSINHFNSISIYSSWVTWISVNSESVISIPTKFYLYSLPHYRSKWSKIALGKVKGKIRYNFEEGGGSMGFFYQGYTALSSFIDFFGIRLYFGNWAVTLFLWFKSKFCSAVLENFHFINEESFIVIVVTAATVVGNDSDYHYFFSRFPMTY